MKGEKRENKEWENNLAEREWPDPGKVADRRKAVIGSLPSPRCAGLL